MRDARLRDFIAVIDAGGVRAAARLLGLTQSAISRNLTALEAELGVPLLLRSNHGIELTEFGRVLLRRARIADAELRKASDEIAGLSGEVRGRVTAWISPAAEAMLMATATEKFAQRYPDVMLRIQGGTVHAGIAALREGKLDFVIGAMTPEGLSSDLKAQRLFSVDMVAVARKGHPLERNADLSALAAARWVFVSPSESFDAELGRLFDRAGLPIPRSGVHRDSFSALLYLLAQTDSITIVSRQSIRMFCECGLLTELPIDLEVQPIAQFLITATGRPMAAPARFLSTEFQRAARAHRR